MPDIKKMTSFQLRKLVYQLEGPAKLEVEKELARRGNAVKAFLHAGGKR